MWAYDFVAICTRDGRHVRLLTVVDEYTSECLGDIMVERGVPEHFRSDNGPEFTARAVRLWATAPGSQDTLHHAGESLGERVRGELQRKVKG